MISRNLTIPILLLAAPIAAQVARAEVAPQQHVQAFYDWYVPTAAKEHKEPAFITALHQRKALFSSELFQALEDDAAVQSKAPGEIVGIDWDPFLHSQDPGDPYKVGKVSTKSGRTLVEVFAVHLGQKSRKPDVIVELVKKDGRWVFTNFRDANGRDLLSALKALSQSRK